MQATFNVRINRSGNLTDLLLSAFKTRMSVQVYNLWISGIISTIWIIWKIRNEVIFEDKFPSTHCALVLLWHCIREADYIDSGTMNNSLANLLILKTFKLSNRVSRAPRIIEIQWKSPTVGWIKVNTDGSANGSPGIAGCGGIFGTYIGFCKCCFAKPLRILYAFGA